MTGENYRREERGEEKERKGFISPNKLTEEKENSKEREKRKYKKAHM